MAGDRIVWLIDSRLTIKQVVERGASSGTIRRVLHESDALVRERAIGRRAVREG